LGEPTDSIFIVQQDLPFQLVYSVTDPDKDPVTGSIARLTMPLPAGMQLVTRRLGDSVLLDVRWTPSCSDLSSVPIILRMEAAESSCASLSSNQLVSIQSVDVVESTIPPNVITPNGDGQNDFFAISYLPDQCLFKGIKIFNRWGRVVFESTSDTFRWNGEPDPGGQYYYLAEYQQKTIKGFVHVMK
jgi:gliding motility-associated-like protein